MAPHERLGDTAAASPSNDIPEQERSVLWGDGPPGLDLPDDGSPLFDDHDHADASSGHANSALGSAIDALDAEAAEERADQRANRDESGEEPDGSRHVYPAKPPRSMGGALFTLILFALLAAGGFLAFKWLQADIESQRGTAPAAAPASAPAPAPAPTPGDDPK